jgi:hypothetical protein
MRKKPTKEAVASRDLLAPPQRLAYLVDEACALLGVSRDTIERAVKAGRLKSGKGLIDAVSLRCDVRRHIGSVGRESTTQTGRRGYRQRP